LIWGDLVPQLLVGAKAGRFWTVTSSQMRWVALHMRLGDALVAEAALDPALRTQVLDLLEQHAPPARARRIEAALAGGDVAGAQEQITPSELYLSGVQAAARHVDPTGFLDGEIRRLAAADPMHCNESAIAAAFGTPKPTLAHSQAPQLLNLRTFPTLMGYSSRILAESWESTNLFFAALADELMMPAAQLNVVIPDWTRRSVEQIFATHLEDWPALLRAMRVTAEQAPCAKPQADGGGEPPRNGGSTAVSVRNSLLTRRALLGTGAALGLTRAVLRAQEPRPPSVSRSTWSCSVSPSPTPRALRERPEAHRVQDPRRRHPTEDRHFRRGQQAAVQLLEGGATRPLGSAEADASKGGIPTDAFTGTNVFVLFDTSNYMYRGYVYASDAIADFVRAGSRRLGGDLHVLPQPLPAGVAEPRAHCRSGRPAQRRRRRRRRVVQCAAADAARRGQSARPESRDRLFQWARQRQHGGPDDVRAVAEDEGIPIYVISTSDVTKDPISSGVFRRLAGRTGGKSFFARTWQKQVEAFEAIREDLGNSYTVTYYPQANPNEGFRKINVEIISDVGKKYRVSARPGYRRGPAHSAARPKLRRV